MAFEGIMHKVFWCPELCNCKLGCAGRNMQQHHLFFEESFFKCLYLGFLLAPSISRKYQLNLKGQRIFRTCLPQALFGQDHCALQIPQMLSFVRTVYWGIKSLPYGNKWSNASASVPLGASGFVGAEMGSSGERVMADL